MGDDVDPNILAEITASYLDEKPDGERVLEAVLEVDADHDTWTFDDLPLDSGTFGELVSRELVVKIDGEYRLARPETVRAVLDGEDISVTEPDSSLDVLNNISIDLRAAGALLGALFVLLVMRLVNYRSVFRDGYVVSPANDPYYYRYWMESLLADSEGVTDFSMITEMPDGAAGTRPLSHAVHWWLAELLGGDQWAADMVAAWLPVVATLALGVVVYWLAVILTDDVRVGVASVLVLALTPVHAVYTGVGFLEHRLHQYLWLGVTMLALVWLAIDVQRRWKREMSARVVARGHIRSPWSWVAALTLGFALPFSAFAWGGSVLMFIPVAAYVALKVAFDVREGLSPAIANAPLLVGLGVSALVSAFLHFSWGWHETFTGVIPALVIGGAVAIVGLGEIWRQIEWPVGGLVALSGGFAAIGLGAFRLLRPADWSRLRERADDLFFREHHGATETGSVFAIDGGIVYEPLFQLGGTFYLALGVLVFVCWQCYRRYEPGWAVAVVYSIIWLVAAAFQVRFAAQLAIPLSILGGLGFVYVLAWIDLVRMPASFRDRDKPGNVEGSQTVTDGGGSGRSVQFPDEWQRGALLVGIGLLLCLFNLIFVPGLAAQTAHDDGQFEAVMAIDDHAESVDRGYPDSYVLSQWGDNRMYNYFVSGESRNYGYAANTYEDFILDSNPDEWYDEFDDRVGYVVVTGDRDEFPTEVVIGQLHANLGAGGPNTDPVAHYQAIYVGKETTAFAVVPGVTITGEFESGETVTVATEHEVSGETIEYQQEVTAGDDGSFTVTVPYPGEYSIDDETIEVSVEDVENGETVTVN